MLNKDMRPQRKIVKEKFWFQSKSKPEKWRYKVLIWFDDWIRNLKSINFNLWLFFLCYMFIEIYPVNTNTRHVIFKKIKTVSTVASIPITNFFSFSFLSALFCQNFKPFMMPLFIFSTKRKTLSPIFFFKNMNVPRVPWRLNFFVKEKRKRANRMSMPGTI